MIQLWKLFIAFFKIGLFTFGGGYAMLPMLQREVVKHHNWATEEELLDIFAIGQCTPGVIAVNTATFIGTKLSGAAGGAVATFAVIFPSVIIITIISGFLKNFSDYEIVKHAFAGIRVAVAALMISSLWKLYQKGVKGAFANVVFIGALLVMLMFEISPVCVVLCSGFIGVLRARCGGK